MSNESYWMGIALSKEADLDIAYRKIEKLEHFFKEICELTVNHDVISCINGNDYASVSPRKIGEALIKVKEDWWSSNGKNKL
jgi:hypothetical protein